MVGLWMLLLIYLVLSNKNGEKPDYNWGMPRKTEGGGRS